NNSLAGRVGYAKWLGVPSDKIQVLYNSYLPSGFHIRRRSETKACRRHLGVFSDAPLIGAVMRFAAEKDPMLWLETAAVTSVLYLLATASLLGTSDKELRALDWPSDSSCQVQPRMSD